jgi:hypothetical protein
MENIPNQGEKDCTKAWEIHPPIFSSMSKAIKKRGNLTTIFELKPKQDNQEVITNTKKERYPN